MFTTCNNASKQAEKIVAQVRMREGATLIKKCEQILKSKETELVKAQKRLEKDTTLVMARKSNSVTHKAVLLGVKAVNRSKLQVEKIQAIQAYVQEVSAQVKTALVKGKDRPHEMTLPTTMEAMQNEIKKIEKQFKEKSNSISGSFTEGTEAEAHQILQQVVATK